MNWIDENVKWREVPTQAGCQLVVGDKYTYVETRLRDDEAKGIVALIQHSLTEAKAQGAQEARERVLVQLLKLRADNDIEESSYAFEKQGSAGQTGYTFALDDLQGFITNKQV